jgi:signal transduction histidine kinase
VLKPGRQDTVHVISGYFFRQFNDGFDYDLKDTPCENVIGQQFRNSILTAMTGYVVLARERVESLGDEKLSRYLERAQRSGQRASDLIQQMLTFSRGQHGEPRPVPLAALIREWIGLLETTLTSSVEIRTALDPQIPLALVDPVQIEQVLMNLCIAETRHLQNAMYRMSS